MTNEEYKSVEMRLMDWSKPVRDRVGKYIADNSGNFVQSTIGAFSIPLRIPTLVRKMANDQTFLWREGPHSPKVVPAILGLASAAVLHWQASYPLVVEEAKRGNYIPLAAVIGANVASGFYELGRLSQSRAEYNALNKIPEMSP